jgi:tetratricopeptide (TPR) repeat protein
MAQIADTNSTITRATGASSSKLPQVFIRTINGVRVRSKHPQRLVESCHIAIFVIVLLAPCVMIAAEQEDRRAADSRVTTPTSLAELFKEAQQHHLAGRLREAEARCREALQEAERAGDAQPMAVVTSRLASVVHDAGRLAEAEVLYLRVVALRTQVHGGTHAEVAIALGNLGVLMANTRRYPEAEQALKQAEDIQKRAPDVPDRDRAVVISGLASLARYRGDMPRAESLYLRALHILQRSIGPVSSDLATAHQNLAFLYAETGQWNHVQLQHQQAMDLWRKTLGPAHPAMAVGQLTLADLLVSKGRWREAEPVIQDALQQLHATVGAEHPEVNSAKCKLAEIYRHLKRETEATAILEQVIAEEERTPGAVLATAMVGLAQFRAEAGNRVSAVTLANRALDVAVETSGEQHPLTAYVLQQQAKILRHLGLAKEAQVCERRAARIIEEQTTGSGQIVNWHTLVHVPPTRR